MMDDLIKSGKDLIFPSRPVWNAAMQFWRLSDNRRKVVIKTIHLLAAYVTLRGVQLLETVTTQKVLTRTSLFMEGVAGGKSLPAGY